MAPIIIFVVLALFTIGIVVFNIYKKQFIDTKNLVFFFPILVILLAIYIIGYIESGETFDGISFFECLKVAFDGFKFGIKRAYVISSMNNNVFFAIDVYWATILASLTLFSAILGFFKIAIINFLASLKKRCQQLDILIGEKEDCAKYTSKYKKCVYWIDSDAQKLTGEDKKKLFVSGVTYINRPFTAKKVLSFTRFAKGIVNIVCFQKEGKYFPQVFKFVNGLSNDEKSSNGNARFHISVQAEEDIISFVDDELGNLTKNNKKVMALSFDIYELMARNFNSKYNLAKYLPKRVIKDYLVDNPNFEINVVMLGFGKTAYALFKGLVLNNQFVHLKDGKYESHLVNYYLFDKEKKAFEKPIVSYLENFDKIIDHYGDTKNGLQPMERPCVVIPKPLNFKATVTDELFPFLKNRDNSFTYFFICSSSSIENASIAKQISRLIDKEHAIIFYNDDNGGTKLSIANEDNIIPFGFKNKVLSHDSICADALWEMAIKKHKDYMEKVKNGKNLDFNEMYLTEKLSNIYRVINAEFKLNCLGYYADKNNGDQVFVDKIYEKLNLVEGKNYYGKYYIPSLSAAIAFQEHTRWNVSYFLNGYKTMKLDEIKLVDNEIVHKNHDSKKHACLISYYSLVDLCKYEEKLAGLKEGEKDCLKWDLLRATSSDTLKSEFEEDILNNGLFIHEMK